MDDPRAQGIKTMFEVYRKIHNIQGSEEDVIKHLLTKAFSKEEDVSDTCSTCGCNEFLCGHNARG